MWLRWRVAYGEGHWSAWHVVTQPLGDTRCGRQPPYNRIETRERKPRQGLCEQCRRLDSRP